MSSKSYFPIAAFFIFSLLASGCATQTKVAIVKTELDRLYDSDFKDISIPESGLIKGFSMANPGFTKNFPHAAFDEIWDSAIIVLIQEGIIVRSAKEKGAILAITKPPMAIFVENGEPVKIYLAPLMNFYEKPLDGCEVTSYNEPEDTTPDASLIKKNEAFFDKLSTQVYSEKKWQYLFD